MGWARFAAWFCLLFGVGLPPDDADRLPLLHALLPIIPTGISGC